MLKVKEQTKTYTVRELLYKLRETLENNPRITPDTKVVLSDFNMSGFKEDIMVEPVNILGEQTLCLFHSLGKPCTEEESVVKSNKKNLITW